MRENVLVDSIRAILRKFEIDIGVRQLEINNFLYVLTTYVYIYNI
jgi:hypothetical protein